MFIFLISKAVSVLLGLVAALFILAFLIRGKQVKSFFLKPNFYVPCIVLILASFSWFFADKTYPPNFAMPPFMHSHAPGKLPASIPFGKVAEFFINRNKFEKVKDIGASPNSVPALSQAPDADGVVRIKLLTSEVISEIAPGIYFNYWTYNGQVPGPMLRVREGDTVEISLTNDINSLHHHNIDLHAVTGPGGGAVLTDVAPGETKVFRWKALNPGLYIYHCAMPNVSTHNSHGQYGLILVEPKEGLAEVDREFYIVQGEVYTEGKLGKKGLAIFDSEALLEGVPNYITFNGRVEGIPRMQAKVGEKIRMYIGNGGVNLISSFHIIGEIFDTVYPNASIGGGLEHNTQAAQVLPGGASIVEFTLDVPGKYILVDHALARMNKGAWAVLEVSGEENKEIFSPIKSMDMSTH